MNPTKVNLSLTDGRRTVERVEVSFAEASVLTATALDGWQWNVETKPRVKRGYFRKLIAKSQSCETWQSTTIMPYDAENYEYVTETENGNILSRENGLVAKLRMQKPLTAEEHNKFPHGRWS